jgi:hypothetical protein
MNQMDYPVNNKLYQLTHHHQQDSIQLKKINSLVFDNNVYFKLSKY